MSHSLCKKNSSKRWLCSCHNVTSTVSNKTHGIIGNLNCSSSNIIYICECLHCSKQYVGKSNGELCVRMKCHRYAINSKVISSALLMHLLDHTQISKDMSETSLEDYDLIPIERLPTTGSYTQDKINRLIRETFWIDTLGRLELNKKR